MHLQTTMLILQPCSGCEMRLKHGSVAIQRILLFGPLYYLVLNPFDVNVHWLRCSQMQKINVSAAKDRARDEPTHSKPCETVQI